MAKNSDKLLKYLGIGALIYFGMSKIGTSILNDISYNKPKIRFGSITSSGIQITIELPITNNTALSIPVQAVQADVMYGENVLSTIFANNNFVVSANETTNVVFNAVLDYSQFSESIVNLIASRSWLQALKLKGHASSGGIVFPFEETFSIG